MQEIMRRIADLKAMRWTLINTRTDPEIFPAALDWLDMTIAEHERDLDALVQKGVA